MYKRILRYTAAFMASAMAVTCVADDTVLNLIPLNIKAGAEETDINHDCGALPYVAVRVDLPEGFSVPDYVPVTNNAAASDIYSSDYGYNALNENEKLVYDAIYARAEEIHNNTEDSLSENVIYYSDGTTVPIYLFQDADPNLWLPVPECTESEANRAFQAFGYDNPKFFWLGHAIYLAGIDNTISLVTFGTESAEYRYGAQRQMTKNELMTEISSVISGADTYKNEYSKEWYAHDYLCKKTIYDPNVNNSSKNPNSHDITGLFLDEVCVCEAYAKSFQLLMNAFGVDTKYILGLAGGGHAWNQVELDGSWYNVDVTWDDIAPENQSYYGDYYYEYFNVTDAEFTDHSPWTGGYVEVYSEEACSATAYAFENHGANFDADVALPESFEINSENFPDDNFRSYVLENIDTDKDNVLSADEIESITSIDVSDKNIASLKGVEYFTALMDLKCYNNQLTSLDLSNNTALIYLSCYDNQLASLDVSNNTALLQLMCNNNNLTSLDVSSNTALEILWCGNNKLAKLDVSGNTSLEQLICSENQLTNLDISGNTVLDTLWCDKNELTKLDVSKNGALVSLLCHQNQLASLDVSYNTALETLWCDNNQLTGVDVSKNIALKDFGCGYNQITSIDVSVNTALTDLKCEKNQLTSLDISKNTVLTELRCGDNQLTSLDVSKNPSLEYLMFENNRIAEIDVSKSVVLIQLLCQNNLLTSLDVSKNTKLFDLACEENQLTSLDVSNNPELWGLTCENNQLTSLDVSNNPALTYFRLDGNQLTSLDVSNNPELVTLCCVDNKLTMLDVSNNTKLVNLDFEANLITSIDVSKNPALEWFNCEFNQLTSLDVSNNTALTNFYTYGNAYDIGEVNNTYSLDNLKGFDPTKASEWTGATYNSETNTLESFISDTVTYTYDCGNGQFTEFTLSFELHNHTISEDWSTDESNHWHACSGCDEKLDSAPHSFTETDRTEPTCTAEGVITYACECGATKTETIEMLEHTYSEEWKTNKTYHWYECSCGEKSEYSAHIWDNGVITTEPTETTEGIKTYTCTVCSRTKSEIVAKLEHTHEPVGEWTTDDAGHWRECDGCEEKLDFANHSYVEVSRTEATCTAEGVINYECVCGKSKTEVLAVIDHTYGEWQSDDENHWVECECGEKKDTALHTFGDWEVIADSTCTETGSEKRSCSVCGKEEIREIALKEHSVYTTWISDTENHWHKCSECQGKVGVEAHKYTQWSLIIEATCEETGVERRYCVVCSKIEARDIEAKGHSYGEEWQNDDENHWHICEECDGKSELIPHNFVEANRTESTCTENGTIEYTCECGATKTETIESTGHCPDEVYSYDETSHWNDCECGEKLYKTEHTASEWIIDKEATATEKGSKHKECTVCKYVMETAEIDATETAPTREEQISDFVERLYTIMLNRASEPEGKKSHVDGLLSGKTAAEIAEGFVLGEELKVWNITNEEFVRRMYLTFLNREADPEGLAVWTSVLDKGCSYGRMFRDFCNSAEFKIVCDSYGISQGSYAITEARDINENITHYCSRMYTKALGRAYDVNGLNNWAEALVNGTETPESVAMAFLNGPEFQIWNHSDEVFVDRLYETLFNRPADAEGKQTWLNLLALGTSRKTAIETFVQSQEFILLKQSLGL